MGLTFCFRPSRAGAERRRCRDLSSQALSQSSTATHGSPTSAPAAAAVSVATRAASSSSCATWSRVVGLRKKGP